MRKIIALSILIMTSIVCEAHAAQDTIEKRIGDWDILCIKEDTQLNWQKQDCSLSTQATKPYTAPIFYSFVAGFALHLNIAKRADEATVGYKQVVERIVKNIDNYDVQITTDKVTKPFIARARAIVPSEDGDDAYFMRNNLAIKQDFNDAFADAHKAKIKFISLDGSEVYEYDFNITGWHNAIYEMGQITHMADNYKNK